MCSTGTISNEAYRTGVKLITQTVTAANHDENEQGTPEYAENERG